ncbi:hypothetical protein JTE90_012057 [Oedothorax gibbosus]|uniref:Uncharacterized protein n=1 Tax=Oedothorax gibbosus TaxID=931172 RepID=A0AAV6TEK8_9ARAC|nr:hypothetical protein JTE90_012057 [Oedothorax gibbosus]
MTSTDSRGDSITLLCLFYTYYTLTRDSGRTAKLERLSPIQRARRARQAEDSVRTTDARDATGQARVDDSLGDRITATNTTCTGHACATRGGIRTANADVSAVRTTTNDDDERRQARAYDAGGRDLPRPDVRTLRNRTSWTVCERRLPTGTDELTTGYARDAAHAATGRTRSDGSNGAATTRGRRAATRGRTRTDRPSGGRRKRVRDDDYKGTTVRSLTTRETPVRRTRRADETQTRDPT